MLSNEWMRRNMVKRPSESWYYSQSSQRHHFLSDSCARYGCNSVHQSLRYVINFIHEEIDAQSLNNMLRSARPKTFSDRGNLPLCTVGYRVLYLRSNHRPPGQSEFWCAYRSEHIGTLASVCALQNRGWGWGCSAVVECFPSMKEVCSLISSTVDRTEAEWGGAHL